MTLRILHTYKSYKPDPIGGVAEVISTLVSQSNAGFQQSLLVARDRGRSRTIVEDGVVVRAVASLGMISSMPVAPSYPFVFTRAVNEIDLVVHHAPFPWVDVGLLLPIPERVGLIVYWHAEVVRSSAIVRCIAPLLRHSLRRADRIIVSHEAMIESSEILQPFAAKCNVVPYSVDAEYWSSLDPSQQIEVAELKKKYPRLIVSVGRLVPYKGFDILIEAMLRVDATLIIMGSGHLNTRLRSRTEALGLQRRIIFVGHQTRDAMKQLFHAAGVFVLPSVTTAEAFGLAQLEAMAAGLPIVNTKLPTAVPHVARHELEAVTVPPGDPGALSRALTRLLDDAAFARRLGKAALDRARSEFSRRAFLSRIENIYQDVMLRRKAK